VSFQVGLHGSLGTLLCFSVVSQQPCIRKRNLLKLNTWNASGTIKAVMSHRGHCRHLFSFQSKAYGLVVASYSPEGTCKNTSTVYLAEPGGKFRVALQQTEERLPDGSVYDGNGIENVQWSPSGTRLLIEVSQWTWGTDTGSYTKYILVTASEDEPREVPILSAIQRYFAQECARLVSSKGWLDDKHIGIEIKPDQDVDEDGKGGPTRSCVGTTTQFSFDVDSGDFIKWR
jgi:hypothetical protein